MQPTKISRFTLVNWKGLKKVDFIPAGNLTIVGGFNGTGKTSFMDGAIVTFGGKKAADAMPVRKGQKKALLHIELDNGIVIDRKVTAKSTTATITGADGQPIAKPQDFLDRLRGDSGAIGFDPLEFIRLDGARQAAALRDLLGLDFTELDAKRATAYAQRHDLNLRAKGARTQMEGLTRHDGVPKEEAAAYLLTEQLDAAVAQDRALNNLRVQRDTLKANIAADKEQIEELKAKLAVVSQRHAGRTIELKKVIEAGKTMAGEVPDIAAIQNRMSELEEVNAKVRENARFDELRVEAENAEKASDHLTETMDAVDAEKAKMIEAASMPVEGLAFDGDTLFWNKIPLDQASSAEQLRVAVAMKMARKTDLKVTWIKDGSLLDDDSLRMIAELADQYDYMIWIERVGEGKECTIVLEDGLAKKGAAA